MRNIDETKTEESSDGKITTFEAFWNICNTIQGFPILSIAYVIQCGGIVSIISLLVVSVTSCYTSYLIVACMYVYNNNGELVRVHYSFANIGSAVWVKGGGTLVLVIQFIQLSLICSLCSFIVSSVLHTLFCHLGVPPWIWILLSALPFLPNAFITNLSQVTWTSIVVIVSAGIIFGSVLIYSLTHTYKWNWSVLLTFNVDKFPVAVMWLMSSYFSQPYVAVIEESMSVKKRFGPILILSFLGMTLINFCMGIIAAATFFPATKEVITDNLPAGPFRILVALTATILSIASFTLPVFTVFEVLEHFCIDNQLIEDKRSENRPSARQVMYRCFIIAMTILLATLPNFSQLVAFLSSFTGTSLEVIFPSLFHIKLCYHRMTLWQLALDVLILIFGVTMLACGLYLSLRTLVIRNSTVDHAPPHLHHYIVKAVVEVQ
ncbi:vesicular inhibitory amino acid transporter-like [Dendronephthya gigantea]|uniref:vesicular inhibitory amino acid transporter-like n=1 Tax=Dendronephthya gigantea TaxID=151771 RepID=UPI00106CA55A|nr:vesicular inhibitory amino acid transporter-like [Dendronephthya gigantea]